MKIIVPMAGRGTRLRPHTLTTPKPLIKLMGKSIVQLLLEDLAEMSDDKIDEIAYVVGDFGKEVEEELLSIAERLGAKGRIFYQEQPLGTGHAVLCAKECLNGNVIVAFADTLFKADFKINRAKDGIIWVKAVENPAAFGVVKTNEFHEITGFVEKPKEFVSDKAIIGIYFFKDGDLLKKSLQHLVDHNITVKGEYQLTDALEMMRSNGAKFHTGKVAEWLDCGNKEATVQAHRSYMGFLKSQLPFADTVQVTNSVIVPPVYLGQNVRVENSVVGPYVSVGDNSYIADTIVQNSIIQENSKVSKANLYGSMLGNHVVYEGKAANLSLGDYNELK